MILSLLNTVIPALGSRFIEIQRNFSAVLGNLEEVSGMVPYVVYNIPFRSRTWNAGVSGVFMF